MSGAKLYVQLDYPLPAELAVGRGSALFVSGWCFCATARIESLSFVVNGEAQPVTAEGMPRLDSFRALHPTLDPYATAGLEQDRDSEADPLMLSYASGFWGALELSPGETWTIALRAELANGEQAFAELAAISCAPQPQPVRLPDGIGTDALVAIAMATYEPPEDLFGAQVESIRAQDHPNWICVISDDCSSPVGQATIEAVIAGDPRFVVSRSERRLGFYRNFERALALAPREAGFVALADQDDRWHPDKLRTLVSELGEAQLIYSDARVVSRHGEVLSETWWSRRENNHRDLLSLIVANAVTGAASLFRRELLDYALPFPPAQFAHYHDHWVALCALCLGEIEFVKRPLYDYVQHGDASLGHEAANRMIPLGERLRRRRPARERVRMWRLHYFVDFCRLVQVATVLRMRCGAGMGRRKTRSIESVLRADRSLPILLRLGLRGMTEFVRQTPQTLGAEWMLFCSLSWRRLLALSARPRPQRRFRLDALPPATLVQHPVRSVRSESAQVVAEKIAPLAWAVSERAPRRINLLIPTIDLQHFFGGYIAKFNLAKRLAERGGRVRIVTVDPVGPLPPNWERSTQSYAGLEGLFDSVEVVFGREAPSIELSREDSFIATTWWTAHIANHALRSTTRDRFLYLIQEYEPFTFPMGTFAALAEQSYRFPHVALFSSDLLRQHFRARGIGVFAEERGSDHAFAFENAISAVTAAPPSKLAGRSPRRLLFYARPESHAARNMFELGMLALERVLQDGLFRTGWELNGIGTVGGARSLPIGAGGMLSLLPRSDQGGYVELLRRHDIGLALMYTPHPSLVPIEMAAAGMVVVTNTFENKTAETMSAISPNILATEPTVEGIAAGLRRAAVAVSDADARTRGSEVAWARDWRAAFPDPLLDALLERLGAAERRAVATSRVGRGGQSP